jgi:uncharacterized protein YndB with AHSA1/START domain
MMSRIRGFRQALGMAGIATLALGASLAAAPAANQTGTSIMTMKQDLADREKDIHWPEGFDPSRADLFSHNALLINASCERIWGHIVDATKWPQWYPNSKDVRMDGGDVLKEGAVFHWSTFGLPLESKVNEFVPYTRIGWYGYAPGTAPASTIPGISSRRATPALSSPMRSARVTTLRTFARRTKASCIAAMICGLRP